MPRLNEGELAPDFTLTAVRATETGGTDTQTEQISLSDLRGQRVILYFYPAAMTPGCTKQACDFRDSLDALHASGFTVLGVSPDTPEKLAKFIARDAITFPLLSDPDHAVMQTYGAWGEKKLYGKTVVGVIRSTLVIDTEGVVELAKYNVKATGHVASLRKALGV